MTKEKEDIDMLSIGMAILPVLIAGKKAHREGNYVGLDELEESETAIEKLIELGVRDSAHLASLGLSEAAKALKF